MAEPSAPAAILGIMLVSGDHARLLAGFTLAAGGLAMGRPTRIFATGPALAACRADYAPGEDAILAAGGLAGVVTLRDACAAMGAELLACDSALHASAIAPGALAAGFRVGGIPVLLAGNVTPSVF